MYEDNPRHVEQRAKGRGSIRTKIPRKKTAGFPQAPLSLFKPLDIE